MSDEVKWSPRKGGILGSSVKRHGDRSLITGRGGYVADLADDDTLHARFVRSTVAHGVMTGVDTEAAIELDGVVAVFTADDLELNPIPAPPMVRRPDVARSPLATDRVRYVGEPIALVIAVSEALAADAADLVWPEIDELPVAMETDPDKADSAVRLFDGSNLLLRETTDPRQMVNDELPLNVTVRSRNQRVAAMAIEGLAVLAEPVGGGRLRVTCGHQAPHRLKQQLAHILGIDTEQVRVVIPDVGGAFGLKGTFFPEYAVVAAAARHLDRSVMWIEERSEHLVAGMHGRDQVHTVTLEGEGSGKVRRAHISFVADLGAYPQGGAIIPLLSRFVASGLYDIEEVTVEMSMVVTNRAPTTSYRGAGRPEAAFAIERAIEEFAVAAGLDPADVRRINFVRSSQLPYKTTTGAVHDSGDYTAALDKAMAVVGADGIRNRQRELRASGGPQIGVGVGAFIERTGGADGAGEFGEVELRADGTLVVRTGSTDSGQGHATVWAQTLAEIFDITADVVDVVSGDTDQVADGVGTYASRSAQVGASAAYRMGLAVRELATDVAAEMLEASAHDIEVVDGAFRVVGVPDSAISIAEVGKHAHSTNVELKSSEIFVPDNQAFPYGVHVAVVEVDTSTGVVDLVRLVTVDDCGNVLNPMIVEGQVHGSLVQGLGQALFEEVIYTEDGIPITSTMMDYLVPTAATIPPMTTRRIVTPAPNNPLGAKGTGEAGCIGAPPAIVNAVIDALRPYGVTNLDMPLTPDRVWAALNPQIPSSKS